MNSPLVNPTKALVLGGSSDGWHADQLRIAALKLQIPIEFLDYESLSAKTPRIGKNTVKASHGEVLQSEFVLTRTMAMGSLESITFRLACLHALHRRGQRIMNPPNGLEVAIDKYASIAVADSLGIPTPSTAVTQTRQEAMDAYDKLGGDVVVKPIFGGEGRGIMRIQNRELAWTTFGTLQALQAVIYLQSFIDHGGVDTRILMVGDHAWTLRRTNEHDFRTNRNAGSVVENVADDPCLIGYAQSVRKSIGLSYAAVDFAKGKDDEPLFLEINGIPGWKQAQSVIKENIAECIFATLLSCQ